MRIVAVVEVPRSTLKRLEHAIVARPLSPDAKSHSSQLVPAARRISDSYMPRQEALTWLAAVCYLVHSIRAKWRKFKMASV